MAGRGVSITQNRGVSARLAWARVFLGFITFWLIFGNILEANAASYSNLMATYTALDSQYLAEQKALTKPQNNNVEAPAQSTAPQAPGNAAPVNSASTNSNAKSTEKSAATTEANTAYYSPNLQTGGPSDLTISADDIIFSNRAPAITETLVITYVIHNVGAYTITTLIAASDESQGQKINYWSENATIVAGGILTATINTRPYLPGGSHQFCVQIINTINRACKGFVVVDTPRLAVAAQDLDTWAGAQSTLLAVVFNSTSTPITLTAATVQLTSPVTAILLSTIPTTTLSPGAQLELSFSISVPITISGSFPITQNAAVLVTGTQATQTITATSPFTLKIFDKSPSNVVVTVSNTPTNTVLPGAWVLIEGNENIYQTNSSGVVTVPTLPGPRTIYSFAPGYIAQSLLITPTINVTSTATIQMPAGQTFNVSNIITYPLTPSDLISRGITITGSQAAYDFVLTLEIGGNPIQPITVPNVIVPAPAAAGDIVNIPPTLVNGGGTSISGQLNYFGPGPDQRVDTWIIIPGRFQYLKQFWGASVYLNNAAVDSSIVITNITAGLNASPQGLSIYNNLTSSWVTPTFTQTVPNIPGAPYTASPRGKMVSWVLRGDAAGTYGLNVTVLGQVKFTGTGITVPLTITAQPAQITIYNPSLSVNYDVPSQVVSGTAFNLVITATNTSPVPLYGVTVQLKNNNLTGIQPVSETPTSLGDLAVGQAQPATFVLTPTVSGCVLTDRSFAAAATGLTPHLRIVQYGQSECPGTPPGQFQPNHALGDCNCNVLHPINPATGNFYETSSDIDFPAVGGSYISLNVARTYNSLDTSSGLFGKGWRSSYDMSLIVTNTDNSLTVINPDGRQDNYSKNANGTYNAPSRANSVLTKLTSTYVLTNSVQIVYTFNSTGQLTSIKDRNNNQININTTNGVVSDNYGRVFTPTFTTNNRVASITDGQRTVRYGYDPTFTQLRIVTDTRGFTTTFAYSGTTNLLYQRYDQTNLVMQNYYDAQNRIYQQVLFAGPSTAFTSTISYNTSLNKTYVTDSRGNTSTYTFDPTSLQPVAVLDAQNNPRSVTLNGNDSPTVITAANGTVVNAAYNSYGKPLSYNTQVSVNGTTQNISSGISYTTLNDPKVITDARGKLTQYDYSAGNLTVITDSIGQVTKFAYDAQGRVISSTSVGGLNTTYSYVASGNGISQVQAMTQTYITTVGITGTNPLMGTKKYRTDFTYTPQSWLASQTDSYDADFPPSPIPSTTYQYDGAGRVLTSTNQLGQLATNNYDSRGNLITATNSLGQKIRYDYDWLNRPLTITQILSGQPNLVSSVSYDSFGNVAYRIDPRGIATSYAYDSLNRLVTTTVPLQSGGSTKTVNTYNGSGNISTVSRLNSCSGCSGDQTTRYEYDELNRLVTTTQGYGSFNYKQVNIYDQNGNVVETRQGKITNVTNWSDPAQVVTSTTNFDDLSRSITSTTYAWNPLTSVNTPLATVYAYNNAQNLNTVVDPYGITAKNQSDPGGRAISTTIMPAPNTNGAQTQFSFNLYEARGLVTRTVDPAGNWADTAYDKLGRATTTTSYTGVGGTGTALTSSTYYTDTAKPQFTSIGPAPDYVRQDSFMDEAGRVLTSTVYTGTAVTYPTVPAGQLNTTYTYDGQSNRLTMTDPTGYITRFGYENSGWLKLVTQTVTPLGASLPVTLTTAYNYDLLGNRLSTLDALSHSSSTVYDILNRVVTETDALNNRWQMAYDGLGRMTSRSDVLNQTSLYTYDNASRMVQLASAGNITTTYSYSAGGQPLTMVDKLGAGAPITTSYDYDGLNRIITTTSPQGLVKYGYDILGRRSSLAYGPYLAKLVTSTYGYDSLSRPVTMSNGLTTPPNQLVSYNYTGERLTSLSYPNGVTATYSYDGASRLTGINQTKGVSTTIFSVNYTLDKLGNRTGLNENLNGQTRTLGYTYDELSRLVKEVTQVGGSQPVTGTYTYDNVGNRSQLVSYTPPTSKGGTNPAILTTTYAYDQADRLNTRIVLAGSSQPVTTTYSYNGNGSLIGESAPGSELVTYTYDVRNRLSNWQKGKGGAVLSTANFKYNGRDTRLSMDYTVITQTQTTNYLQDTGGGLPVVLMETNPTTGGVNNFLYPLGSTSPIFEEEQTGTEMWYHSDGLGSVRALTGSSGNVLNTYAYNAFGEKTGGTYNSKLETDHQFAGEQLDPTGLYYNRARYYNPGLGRFIGRDSYQGDLNIPGSLNNYVYAANNPAIYTDPSGFRWVRVDSNEKNTILGQYLGGSSAAGILIEKRIREKYQINHGRRDFQVGSARVLQDNKSHNPVTDIDIVDTVNKVHYQVKPDDESEIDYGIRQVEVAQQALQNLEVEINRLKESTTNPAYTGDVTVKYTSNGGQEIDLSDLVSTKKDWTVGNELLGLGGEKDKIYFIQIPRLRVAYSHVPGPKRRGVIIYWFEREVEDPQEGVPVLVPFALICLFGLGLIFAPKFLPEEFPFPKQGGGGVFDGIGA